MNQKLNTREILLGCGRNIPGEEKEVLIKGKEPFCLSNNWILKVLKSTGHVPPLILGQEIIKANTYHKRGWGYIRKEVNRNPLADERGCSKSGKSGNVEWPGRKGEESCQESRWQQRRIWRSNHLFIYLTTPGLRCSTEIFRCGTQALGCGMWDLVPWSGIKPGPPALGAWSLARGPAGKSPNRFFRLRTAAIIDENLNYALLAENIKAGGT